MPFPPIYIPKSKQRCLSDTVWSNHQFAKMGFRNKVEVYCRLDYYRRNMSEKLSGCWLFIGEDWWGSRKLYSPVLAFLGTLHLHFLWLFLLFLGWCFKRQSKMLYWFQLGLDVLFWLLNWYIHIFSLFENIHLTFSCICQNIVCISIDIFFTFICILACPFLFLSAYYTLQKWGSGKVSI